MSQNKLAPNIRAALYKNGLPVNHLMISSGIHVILNSFSNHSGICPAFNCDGDAC